MGLKGNQYYLLRSKDGRDKEYSPESFLKKANEYFEWCLSNPLKETVVQKIKVSRDEEEIKLIEVPKMRPFTIQGLCNYLEIHIQTFYNYEKDDDFFDVTTRVRGIIENYQFEGAATNLLNANIIARKLGLSDKSEVRAIVEQPLFPEE